VSTYVDTSALLKRYIEEPESDVAERHLLADPVWLTARHTFIEVRRNLVRLLEPPNLDVARSQFDEDWARMHVVELDEHTCRIAADLAEITVARTLDALHLAALRRVGEADVVLLTFDVRQARAARDLGMRVLGV
jgi:predicted nucleic acid-binding protein